MSAGSEISPEEICTPCRGTGRLTSGLGGQPHEVQCPWCRGTVCADRLPVGVVWVAAALAVVMMGFVLTRVIGEI